MMMNIKTHSLFCLISICLFFNPSLHVLSARKKTDSFLLSCGSTSAETDSDGRKWEPDKKFLASPDKASSATAQFQDPSLPSTTPYMSAMLFTVESTYSFPITTKGRYWLRLYFYPSTYNDLDSKDAYFTVKAGGITLLKNFSAAITATALTQAYIIREYSVFHPSAGALSLTFTPSTEHNKSFAFVNGIELVSMPELFQSASLVGFAEQSIDTEFSTMQTMYRLNVGGQYIPASNDSDLTRAWYDDTPYLYGASEGVAILANSTDKIHYPKDVPEYIAPVDVYASARAMGPDSSLNKNFNLTWAMQVDANFTYVVRLHFCEFQMIKANQRPFEIFINNHTAIQSMGQFLDVIVETGSPYVPYYMDFAVSITDVSGDEQLWVALHPYIESKPEFYNAILNGMEVFKMNDTTGNLAGPNPVPSQMLLQAESAGADDSQSKSNRGKVIAGTAGGAAAVGVVAALCIVVYNRKKREQGGDFSFTAGWLPMYGNSTTGSSYSSKSSSGSALASLAGGLCRHFSLAELKHGTKNFNESNVIGVGGFGKVYKGVVDGSLKVAIKRANPSSEQGVHEFRTEIEMLSKLRHRHLVSLIGFCEEDDEMILVYDYMVHGTLREHLYKGNKHHLSWKQRLEICIGAARGLHYLHTGAKYTIIHRDVKTTNILVDENWVAKVSDFGLSKTGPSTVNQTHVSTVVKGSFGYLDPEYFRRQQLTDKSDVYSFGVVLFEVLCARPALNPSLSREQVSLADWALHCQRKGILEDITDPHLKGKITPECFKKFAETAENCLADQGIFRPSMGDVLWNLEFALQLQENPDKDPTNDRPSKQGPEGEKGEDSDTTNPNADFSQLMDPVGR